MDFKESIGPDAGIEVNENGGKQSATVTAMHLIDPEFLLNFANSHINSSLRFAFAYISNFMVTGNKNMLFTAITTINAFNSLDPTFNIGSLVTIAQVLKEGAEKYEVNNWRLIPQEEHINHALNHLVAHCLNDVQDDHLDHAMCRLMMAYATEPSEGFKYI